MKKLFLVLITVLFFVSCYFLLEGFTYNFLSPESNAALRSWDQNIQPEPEDDSEEIKTVDCREVEDEDWAELPPAKDVFIGQTVTGVSGQEYKLETSTDSVCDYAWVPVEDGKIKTVDCRNVVEEDWVSLPPAKDVFIGQTVTGVSGQEYKLETSTDSVCDYAWVPVEEDE